jgi:hypothetical protein
MSTSEAASCSSPIPFPLQPTIQQLLQTADRAQRAGEREVAERLIAIAFERLDQAYVRNQRFPGRH